MECEVDVSLPAPFCDVGVQVTPSKKNARVQARPKSISVGENSLLLRRSLIVDVNSLYISGIQVNIEPKMKDAQIQCNLPAQSKPIMKDGYYRDAALVANGVRAELIS